MANDERGKANRELPGAFAYENWKLAIGGASPSETLEYPLFGDVRIVGEVIEGLGPYEVLNCIADPNIDPHRALLVLRVTYYGEWKSPDWGRTDTSRYHGGTSADEIAALLSLSLGIRLKAGGATRWFKPGGDPRGRPWGFRERGQPDPAITRSSWGDILPRKRQQEIEGIQLLSRLSELTAAQSIAVVRAGRLYQDALWISESEPALAWLLFVSALETAAGEWRRLQDSPRARMRESRPELDALLELAGGSDLADQVAEMIADQMGSTKKFVEFCLSFVPAPPPVRPAEHIQIPWTIEYLRRALRLIYGYRSKALHAGTPFPAPMCAPPQIYQEAQAERIQGGGAGALGGIWMARDLPMFLHVFEYITRNVLLSWWESLLPHRPASSDGTA